MQNFSDYSNGAGGPPTVLPPVDKFANAPASFNTGRAITAAAGLATRMNPTSLARGAINMFRTPDAPGTPGIISNLIAGATGADVPSKAATAASTAASDAFGMGDRGAGFDGSRVAPAVVPPTGPSGNVGEASAFSDRAAAMIANMTGQATPDVQKTLSMPLPAYNKTGGDLQGTTNFDTTTGAARRLNAGYGSEIIGSGATQVRDTGDGRLHTRNNNFTGVGQGPQAAGAAGVFGPGSAPSSASTPVDHAYAHITDIMKQAEQKRAQGDGLGAKSLENHAARLGSLFAALSQHAYQTGLLKQQGRVTNLAEQQALAPIEIDRQVQKFLAAGDIESASRLRAASRGAPAFSQQVVQPGTYGIDAFSADDTRTAYPYFNAPKQ